MSGGVALSLLLMSPSRLQSLVLRWNSIRLGGGEALAASLASNSHLTHLDLSYNILGR